MIHAPLTVKDLAAHKKLDPRFLRERLGWRDGPKGVEMPYREAEGTDDASMVKRPHPEGGAESFFLARSLCLWEHFFLVEQTNYQSVGRALMPACRNAGSGLCNE